MSLEIAAGGSGAGKSYTVYKELIDESIRHPERDYIVIVPEQFTMQTQKDLVTMHPCHGLLNVDVLSFNRLAWRVFAETGGNTLPVLEDTGKSLVVRHVIAEKKSELHVLSRTLDRQGAAAEKLENKLKQVKSITEFLEQGMKPEDILQEILGDMDLEILDTLPTQFYCSCSKARMEKALITLGEKELQGMVDDGKPIELNCQFCGNSYKFTPEELRKILATCRAAKAAGSTEASDGAKPE